jgi:hypothetical protein
MNIPSSIIRRVGPVLFACVALGCHRDPVSAPSAAPATPDGAASANATVHFVAIEGGCWVLETSGAKYEPVNLPVQDRVDGLRVYVEFNTASSNATKCMVAPLISIIRIRAG